MNAALDLSTDAMPFFLNADDGARFCLYHAPAAQMPARGAILYVHPFAEELNKSRRMASLQARSFSRAGFGVLQLDLFGCGDSDGDFVQARWANWRHDLLRGAAWLRKRHRAPLLVWGLRLGGLLALDAAHELGVDGVVLWQPVTSGAACIRQFLRVGIAAKIIDDGAFRAPLALRSRLDAEQSIEIAGYQLSAALARDIESIELANMALPSTSIDCFVGSAADKGDARRAPLSAHPDLRFNTVDGLPFWSTSEVTICPSLLAATSSIFELATQ